MAGTHTPVDQRKVPDLLLTPYNSLELLYCNGIHCYVSTWKKGEGWKKKKENTFEKARF